MSFSFGNLMPMLCIRSSLKHQKLLMLFIGVMVLNSLLWAIHYSQLPVWKEEDFFLSGTHLENRFTACEKEMKTAAELEHLRPMDVSKIQYKRVLEAERVVAYIVREMDKMGAPVSLMFGSLLHEYRNGTGNCVEYNMRDKDLDLVVLPEHFPNLFGMIDDIKAKFGWKVLLRNDKKLFLMFAPHDLKVCSTGFQIDIYSFHRDHPKEGLLYFPWDSLAFEMDLFFPLVKYKSIPSPDFGVTMNETANEIARSNNSARSTSDDDSISPVPVSVNYHVPPNIPCLLGRLYGDDFMTPQSGSGSSFWIGLRKDFLRQSRWCNKTGAEAEDRNFITAN